MLINIILTCIEYNDGKQGFKTLFHECLKEILFSLTAKLKNFECKDFFEISFVHSLRLLILYLEKRRDKFQNPKSEVILS